MQRVCTLFVFVCRQLGSFVAFLGNSCWNYCARYHHRCLRNKKIKAETPGGTEGSQRTHVT